MHPYWHHFAVSYDKGNPRTTLYADGESMGAIETVATIDELSALVIGRHLPEGGARFCAGLIDEMRLWNYGRTAEQVHLPRR